MNNEKLFILLREARRSNYVGTFGVILRETIEHQLGTEGLKAYEEWKKKQGEVAKAKQGKRRPEHGQGDAASGNPRGEYIDFRTLSPSPSSSSVA